MTNLLHSSEFLSALAGAIVGALAGGIIAWLLQRQVLREARRDRADERKLVQQGLGYSLLFKLSRITSDFIQIHDHVEEYCEKGKGELWERVIPLGNLPLPIHFSSDEVAMLFLQEDNDVFNAVVSLDGAHSSLIDILRLYAEQRASLTKQLPRAVAIEGQLISHVLDKEHILALAPTLATVSSIVEQLRTYAARDAKDATLALKEAEELLRKRLGLTFRSGF